MNISKTGQLLFVTLILLTVSYPSSQSSLNTYLIANLNQHNNVNGYSIGMLGYVQNGREYAILGCYLGTSFVDVTDSANIHEVGFVSGVGSSWRDFKTYSHYCYIVGDVTGCYLQIVDLQYLPDSVHFVTTYSFSGFYRAHTIEQSGPYLYVNGGNYLNEGVFVLDLSSDPTNPVKRGQWEFQYVHDDYILNDTIWACNIYTGTISVISATNKDSLYLIKNWPNGSGPAPHNCAISYDRKYLLTTDEILNPVGRLKVWNIEDLNNVQQVATWWPVGGDSSNVHNVVLFGRYAVIAHYTAGIRILDVSYPPSPIEVAYFDTYPQNNGNTWNGCKGIYVLPSGKILANDKQTGLYVVRTTFSLIGVNPENQVAYKYSLKQNYPNPFNPSTTIEFTSSINELVTLKVYDLLGRLVKTLLNSTVPGGDNKFTFSMNDLSSGVYFYKIQFNSGFSDTKKMILIK